MHYADFVVHGLKTGTSNDASYQDAVKRSIMQHRKLRLATCMIFLTTCENSEGKDPYCHLRSGSFITGNQIMMMTT